MQHKKAGVNAFADLSFEKQSASERVAQVFLEKIKNRELENGHRMPPQRELAQMFGVGMSTIREALKILNVMGCVHAIHGKGTFVVHPSETRDEIVDINQALKLISFSDVMVGRQAIECAAAELAAQNAKLENLEEIRNGIDEMEKNAGDWEAWYDADLMGFHLTVARASRNQTLMEVCKTLIQRVRQEFTPQMMISLDNFSEENFLAALQTAREVYQHIKARDPKGASFALKEHLSIVLEHERLKKTESP